MHKVKNIFRNINLLNIMLITAVIILANYTVLPMFNMNIRYTLPAGKKTIGDTDEKPAEGRIPSPSDYMIIAEENLFHPERKIPVEKKAEQPLPKPEFVLFGTLITDDLSLAYLEDLKVPRSTPGRGKRQTAMRKGDSMSGFTLKEIETDKVVMLRGEEQLVVLVNDPSRSKERKETGVTTAPAATQKPPQQMPAAASSTQQKQQIQATREQRRQQLQPAPPPPTSSQPSNQRSRIQSGPKNRDGSRFAD